MTKNIFAIPLIAAFLSVIDGPASAAVMSKEDSLLAARKHFSFAVQYKRNGEHEEALRQYRESLAYNDTVYQVHYSFAELLMILGRSEHAKAEYLKTLGLNPAHRPSASILAGMYARAGAYDSVLVMYDAIRAIDPSDSLLDASVKIREYLGRDAEALEGLRELISHGLDDPGIFVRAARLSIKTGDVRSAEEYASKALAIRPGDRDALRIAYKSAIELGETERAVPRLEALAAIDTTDASTLGELAKIYRSEGKSPDLIRILARLNGLDPDNTAILGELAELTLASGETDRAGDYAAKGISLEPSDGRLRIVMGEIWRLKGKKDRALAEYRAALADPQWRDTAGRLIEHLNTVPTDTEKKERDFFNRGKTGK